MAEPESDNQLQRVGRGKHLGGWFGRLAGISFGSVTVESEVVSRLQAAYQTGTVVHVIRSRRVLDPLFTLSVLDRLNLRKPSWMHDHYASKRANRIVDLISETAANEPSLLFLRKPRTITTQSSAYSENYIEALIEQQMKQERPILLLPQSLSWKRTPGGIRRSEMPPYGRALSR